MTRPRKDAEVRARNLRELAAGDFGRALVAAIDALGGIGAFAKRLGFTPGTVRTWIGSAIVPSQEAAFALAALCPDLRPHLEKRGAFRDRRKRAPTAFGQAPQTSAEFAEKVAAGTALAAQRAELHAAGLDRRTLIARAAGKVNRRARARLRKQKKLEASVAFHERRIDRRGDWIEELCDIGAEHTNVYPVGYGTVAQ